MHRCRFVSARTFTRGVITRCLCVHRMRAYCLTITLIYIGIVCLESPREKWPPVLVVHGNCLLQTFVNTQYTNHIPVCFWNSFAFLRILCAYYTRYGDINVFIYRMLAKYFSCV